jgi:lysozyme family protein
MPDERFDAAVAAVLANVASYGCDPDAQGGTGCGLSGDGPSELNIALPTDGEAREIYCREYWLALRLHRLPGVLLPAKMLELAVNLGPRTAVRLLQRALRACGRKTAEDGRLGPATLAAVEDASPQALLAALRSEAAGHCRELSAARPALEKFRADWLARAYS